jgi:hypothetical protein
MAFWSARLICTVEEAVDVGRDEAFVGDERVDVIGEEAF